MPRRSCRFIHEISGLLEAFFVIICDLGEIIEMFDCIGVQIQLIRLRSASSHPVFLP